DSAEEGCSCVRRKIRRVEDGVSVMAEWTPPPFAVSDFVTAAIPDDERLCVRRSGVLSRHRHPAPVHGYVIKGTWRYLEHNWIAKAGDYVFEPPGEVHTLTVDSDDEMITLFHVCGALIYFDDQHRTCGYDDVHTKID